MLCSNLFWDGNHKLWCLLPVKSHSHSRRASLAYSGSCCSFYFCALLVLTLAQNSFSSASIEEVEACFNDFFVNAVNKRARHPSSHVKNWKNSLKQMGFCMLAMIIHSLSRKWGTELTTSPKAIQQILISPPVVLAFVERRWCLYPTVQFCG